MSVLKVKRVSDNPEEAIQFTGSNFNEVRDFSGTRPLGYIKGETMWIFNPIGTYIHRGDDETVLGELYVQMLGTFSEVRRGDWIVKEPQGFFVWSDKNFKASFRIPQEPTVPVDDVSPTLIWILRRATDSFGALGVMQTLLELHPGIEEHHLFPDTKNKDSDSPKESPTVIAELPAYLPGQNRDWIQVKARAKIFSDDHIEIKILDEMAAADLIAMAENNVLLQLSFDYRMSDDIIDKINTMNPKRCNPRIIFIGESSPQLFLECSEHDTTEAVREGDSPNPIEHISYRDLTEFINKHQATERQKLRMKHAN